VKNQFSSVPQKEKFSRESASVFTASGMPVFFTPDSVVRAAAVLCGGKKLVENHDGI
jgi:acyl-CoA synthetase (NDP forming)